MYVHISLSICIYIYIWICTYIYIWTKSVEHQHFHTRWTLGHLSMRIEPMWRWSGVHRIPRDDISRWWKEYWQCSTWIAKCVSVDRIGVFSGSQSARISTGINWMIGSHMPFAVLVVCREGYRPIMHSQVICIIPYSSEWLVDNRVWFSPVHWMLSIYVCVYIYIELHMFTCM